MFSPTLILNFLCLLAPIIHELWLVDEGNWESSQAKNFNLNLILTSCIHIMYIILSFFFYPFLYLLLTREDIWSTTREGKEREYIEFCKADRTT